MKCDRLSFNTRKSYRRVYNINKTRLSDRIYKEFFNLV